MGNNYQDKIREICSSTMKDDCGDIIEFPILREDQFQAIFNLIEEERRMAVEEHKKHPF